MILTIEKPTGIAQWGKLYRLYRSAFPRSERKPFFMILRMYRRGKTDLWCIGADGAFAGLAATINGEDTILLDYFAVEDTCRGKGVGSAALKELRRRYAGKGLFVEIESVYEATPDQEQRLGRKRFYLANGMRPLNVMVRLFGVRMELLGYDCRMDYQGYCGFYRDNYNEWAASHIGKETHPEE